MSQGLFFQKSSIIIGFLNILLEYFSHTSYMIVVDTIFAFISQVIRLRKGQIGRAWENLCMAMLGEQFMVNKHLHNSNDLQY